ncbi:MAG: class II glutamine amidotransferase, partial [Candidatus Obscuribacterales bacterium]|nr:class II glutamine amidotransferase [Candidatus Obscuribacterales bacterium]
MNSEIIGMSFDSPASPSITLTGLIDQSNPLEGWGFGWYPGDDAAGVVIKNPRSMRESVMTRVLRDWDRFRSTIFVCHIRGAAKRVSQQDTLPFLIRYANRHFIFSHNGKLSRHVLTELSLGEQPLFEPVGRTDSEHAFCWLLSQLRLNQARSLGKADRKLVHSLFLTLNKYGTANFLVTDGQVMVIYNDVNGAGKGFWYAKRRPPHKATLLQNDLIEIDFGDPLDQSCSMLLFSTTPLNDGDWQVLEPGEMVVARLGKIIWTSSKKIIESTGSHSVLSGTKQEVSAPQMIPGKNNQLNIYPALHVEQQLPIQVQSQVAQAQASDFSSNVSPSIEKNTGNATSNLPSDNLAQACSLQADITHSLTTYADATIGPRFENTHSPLVVEPLDAIDVSGKIKPRVLQVLHETVYEYDEPVDYSTHRLHLYPVHDSRQEVIEAKIDVSPRPELREFEDVFGNRCVDLKIDQSYRRLAIRLTARVIAHPPPQLRSTSERMTVPLVWMPWQRQMMLPYLLPPELPESELRTLTDYAMGFVKREDYDLLEALVEMNRTIFTDFEYVSGSTTLMTTPFEVLIKRKG